MLQFKKARSTDTEALAQISERAFHSDIHCGAPELGGPPGYNEAGWQAMMMRGHDYFKIIVDNQIVGGHSTNLFAHNYILTRDRDRIPIGVWKRWHSVRMHEIEKREREVQSNDSPLEPALKLAKSTIKVGEEFEVHFAVPSSYSETAFVAMVPINLPHGAIPDVNQFLTFQLLDGHQIGILVFEAPDQPEKYDLRMYDRNTNKEIVCSTFDVITNEANDALMNAETDVN